MHKKCKEMCLLVKYFRCLLSKKKKKLLWHYLCIQLISGLFGSWNNLFILEFKRKFSKIWCSFEFLHTTVHSQCFPIFLTSLFLSDFFHELFLRLDVLAVGIGMFFF